VRALAVLSQLSNSHSRLLRALIERIGKATRTAIRRPNDLKMEFWATSLVAALLHRASWPTNATLGRALREQGVALIRITANSPCPRAACVSSQATRLFDWLKQGELAGVDAP
jgi:hypothetical protein